MVILRYYFKVHFLQQCQIVGIWVSTFSTDMTVPNAETVVYLLGNPKYLKPAPLLIITDIKIMQHLKFNKKGITLATPSNKPQF